MGWFELPRLTYVSPKKEDPLITVENVGQRPSLLSPSSVVSKFLVVAAAAIPAALYLLFVYHYAVNVPFADDWEVMGIVSPALHGHLTMSLLWSQWTSSREVTGRLVFISFGFIDHLNLRAVMLLSAGIFVATFVLVLICVRSYLGRRLTFWPVLTLGVVWFSLVDFRNSLWSNQLSWYLCLFFVVAVVHLLLVSRKNALLSLGLGVVAAVLASLSFSFGFLAWPLGLICLLWRKRGRLELTIWIIAAVAMAVVYFHGWQTNGGGCLSTSVRCSLTYGLSRPDRLIEYYVLLVGNVVPLSSTGIETHLWMHIVQGIGLLLGAILVGVQTFRERQVQANPLPLLLIVFGLLFDLMIAPSRFGVGLKSSVSLDYSRYTMPNVLLLVAIVILPARTFRNGTVPVVFGSSGSAHWRHSSWSSQSLGTCRDSPTGAPGICSTSVLVASSLTLTRFPVGSDPAISTLGKVGSIISTISLPCGIISVSSNPVPITYTEPRDSRSFLDAIDSRVDVTGSSPRQMIRC